MQVIRKYVVYKLNYIIGSEKNKTLEEVVFNSEYITNEFYSEDQAIEALLNDDKIIDEYVILRQICIKY